VVGATDEPATRVAIIEDDRTTREALRLLIDGTPGYACVGAFGSVEEALRLPARWMPAVVLLDIDLPGISGADGVPLVQERFPDAVVLMLTVFEDDEKVFRSLCNGASGYILKKTPPAKLLDYIGEAVAGGAPMSLEIAGKVIRAFKMVAPKPLPDSRLTPRDTRLLELLARGYGYQEAADELGITINTVRNHVRSIYEKLHVHTNTEAVGKALRARLI
jgi:DNA-binding NarL/FixJ family response regulator